MTGGAPSELDFIPTAHAAKQAAAHEWHMPCPRCGGTDRFIVHAMRPFPSWLWMCRVCSPDWKWLDELNPALKRQLTDAERRDFAQARAQLEETRAAELDRRIREFTAAETWAAYARKLTADARAWWRSRGIPDDWQDYFQVGYTEDKIIRTPAGIHRTPAYTIPYLRPDAQPATLQYRLQNPPDPKDKYRFEPGLPAAWYTADPVSPIGDQVVICEGAIKAMVTAVSGGLRQGTSILAVPSKSAWANIDQAVRNSGRVWVVLDPDGQGEALRLARRIGDAARVVMIPEKIDDALLAGMTPEELQGFFRYARKV